MCRYSIQGVFLLLTLALYDPFALSAGAQKAVHERPMEIHHSQAPGSLGEMMAEASTVVLAAQTGKARIVDRSGVPTAPLLMTAHTLRVTRVFKDADGTFHDGYSFDVFLPGGEKEYADRIERAVVPGVDTLRPGRSYLLFLSRDAQTGERVLAWGPHSVLDVTSGRVAAIASAKAARRYDGMTLDEVVAALTGNK